MPNVPLLMTFLVKISHYLNGFSSNIAMFDEYGRHVYRDASSIVIVTFLLLTY